MLHSFYATSFALGILHIRTETDTFQFKDDGNWKTYVEKFSDIHRKLETYDVEVPENENARKLLRTLPKSFAPSPMAFQMTSVIFDKLANAVDGEMSPRENQHRKIPMTTFSSNQASKKHMDAGKVSRAFRNGPGNGLIHKNSKWDNIDCYVCSRRGHRAQDCCYKAQTYGL